MRKKTVPRARKQNNASSCDDKGLITKHKTSRRSAETESVLDNRSHRTPLSQTARPDGREWHRCRLPICRSGYFRMICVSVSAHR
jgi:hypothetical protein